MMAPHRKAAAARKMQTGRGTATLESVAPASQVSSMTQTVPGMAPRAMVPPHRKYAGGNNVTSGPHMQTSPHIKTNTAAHVTGVPTTTALSKDLNNKKISDENKLEVTAKIAVGSKTAPHLKITPK